MLFMFIAVLCHQHSLLIEIPDNKKDSAFVATCAVSAIYGALSLLSVFMLAKGRISDAERLVVFR